MKKVDKVVDRYLSEVNRCGEECLRLCSVNFGNVCTKGCRREWNDCKGIPQDQFGWIPKLHAWKGVSREPSHPGNALREFSETYCDFRSKYFVQVFDIYNWKGLLSGRFNFDVLC